MKAFGDNCRIFYSFRQIGTAAFGTNEASVALSNGLFVKQPNAFGIQYRAVTAIHFHGKLKQNQSKVLIVVYLSH